MALVNRYHIMIIDDDKDTLELMRLALERKRFRVTTAMTWDDIVERVRINYKDTHPFDAIILDLMMPDRSGFDVLVALQAMVTPLPPVIVLSAITDIRNQIRARELGVKKYLTKPTTPAKLVQTITEVLQSI